MGFDMKKCDYPGRAQDGDFTCGIHGDLRTVRCDGCEHHGPRPLAESPTLTQPTPAAPKLAFKIEQIEIRPENRERARKLLEKIGLTNWIDDLAAACGTVGERTVQNVAQLSCCYDGEPAGPLKLELINFPSGANCMDGITQTLSSKMGDDTGSIISHIGMHCTLAELAQWRALLNEEGIAVVQETTTTSHANPAVANSRRYLFCTFGTRHILGCDLKFIVRLFGAVP
jgi:hypothetical protein